MLGDSFGSSVAIDGETIVVGAFGDDVDNRENQGSAYVFVRSGVAWTQQQKLTANDGSSLDWFGWSVGISGEVLVVGASVDDNGTGSAYVFVRGGATWTQQAKLTADDRAPGDTFGSDVGISGETVVVGGTETTQAARGVCDGVTIPANALGVVGNATVVSPVGQGFLTLWPSTAGRPLVATSNYHPGDVGNRHFIVGLGQADGAFRLYTQVTTHLVIDLSGYFAP